MEGSYGVYFGKQLCGKVQVLRQGLYYRFVCRCRLSGDVVCRLRACFPDREENLGILVPMDGGFGLSTMLPVKRFTGTCSGFRIVPRQEEKKGTFVPIYPEEPFAYIERLKNAFLAIQNGQIGAVLREEVK